MNELQKLKADHAALEERIAALEAQQAKKPKVDWSQMKGRLVEVRDFEDRGWVIRVFEKRVGHLYYTQNSCNWEFCRPYTGPLRPNFITHDGGACPVDRNALVVVSYGSDIYAAGFAFDREWTQVTGYQVIEP